MCDGDLAVDALTISCASCGSRYPVDDSVPLLFVGHDAEGKPDVTDTIKSFYEETPFPNYDDMDDADSLARKAGKSFFAQMLNTEIPPSAKVLEVGCGTGQLTNYLGIAGRTVFGADMTLNALKLGQAFKEKNGLAEVGFYQMNLFRPIFKDESFDLVICNGVLHHTGDPEGGFRSIARLVKRGGFILIGLYNTYGRLATDARRTIFSLTRGRASFLDPYLARADVAAVKKKAWFNDQYKNPHESKHTMGEAIRWFDAAGFDFVSGIPSPTGEPFTRNFRLFAPHSRGTVMSRFFAEMRFIASGNREGGLFTMVARRR